VSGLLAAPAAAAPGTTAGFSNGNLFDAAPPLPDPMVVSPEAYDAAVAAQAPKGFQINLGATAGTPTSGLAAGGGIPGTAPPAPPQGVSNPGMLAALAQMRSMFGPRPLPGPPPPGAAYSTPAPVQQPQGPPQMAAGNDTPQGAWTPPPVPYQATYNQPPILTGQGGGEAYFDALRRLAPQQRGW
jgi:hypothetical protein